METNPEFLWEEPSQELHLNQDVNTEAGFSLLVYKSYSFLEAIVTTKGRKTHISSKENYFCPAAVAYQRLYTYNSRGTVCFPRGRLPGEFLMGMEKEEMTQAEWWITKGGMPGSTDWNMDEQIGSL